MLGARPNLVLKVLPEVRRRDRRKKCLFSRFPFVTMPSKSPRPRPICPGLERQDPLTKRSSRAYNAPRNRDSTVDGPPPALPTGRPWRGFVSWNPSSKQLSGRRPEICQALQVVPLSPHWPAIQAPAGCVETVATFKKAAKRKTASRQMVLPSSLGMACLVFRKGERVIRKNGGDPI